MTRSNTSTALIFTVMLALAAAPGLAQISQATVAVDGMSCPFCAYGVEKRLSRVPGVESVDIDMADGVATVTAAEGASIEVSRIPQAVRKAGFTPGAIELVALGRVEARANDGWRFDLGAEDGQELLLVNLTVELAVRVAALAGSATRVRVTGGVHFHSDFPPGVEPSAIDEVEDEGVEEAE
ncbi:MAG: heavy-metal-associated domain-containing protein [Thermoanaerobaculia bacterium]